jgi:hypothetical protein
VDELRHGLLGHLRARRERADGRAGVVQVLEHRAVGRAHEAVATLGEPDEHQIVERHERLAQQHDQVGRALAEAVRR